jgi:hypothetical protein
MRPDGDGSCCRGETQSPCDRNLNSNSSPDIGPLGSGDVNPSGNTGRGRLSNNVKQNFANLSCTGSDRVPLFILQGVDLTVSVKGKNHWFRVHSEIVSNQSTGTRFNGLSVPSLPKWPLALRSTSDLIAWVQGTRLTVGVSTPAGNTGVETHV